MKTWKLLKIKKKYMIDNINNETEQVCEYCLEKYKGDWETEHLTVCDCYEEAECNRCGEKYNKDFEVMKKVKLFINKVLNKI